MDGKKRILDFIKAQQHMVISTVSEHGKPEAALVGFGEADDLGLIFGTYKTSRKYQNLQANPNIAIVFGHEEGITVQYEGIAMIPSESELQKYKNLYFAKTSTAKKFENHKNQVYFKITPSWIRYTDYTQEKEEVFEISF